jgi:hypothetical protein
MQAQNEDKEAIFIVLGSCSTRVVIAFRYKRQERGTVLPVFAYSTENYFYPSKKS